MQKTAYRSQFIIDLCLYWYVPCSMGIKCYEEATAKGGRFRSEDDATHAIDECPGRGPYAVESSEDHS